MRARVRIDLYEQGKGAYMTYLVLVTKGIRRYANDFAFNAQRARGF